LKRTEDLGNYLKIITDKEEDEMDQVDAIELACLLFINSGDSSYVEVSSLHRDEKRQYLVREYLNRIRLLKYDRVELSWTDISYISKLRKGEDGNYYGVITFQQLFRGFIDGKIEYQDVTQKDIEVVLTTYEEQVRGMTIFHWDVFLSNIGVQETKEK
jgi:transcriptional antiterminator Rof (Rho-off)